MDAIREVGPGSHYLGCDHTQANFQTAFYRSIDRRQQFLRAVAGRGREDAPSSAPTSSRGAGSETYEAPPLDPAIDEALKDFIAKKKASMPDAFT